jgi:hypothetical protein
MLSLNYLLLIFKIDMRKLYLLTIILISAIRLNGQTVEDFDGNQYNVVRIGEQEWIQENLRTTRNNDGSEIPLIKDSTVGFYQGNFNMGCSVRCVRAVPSDKNPGEFQNGKLILK